MARVRCEEALDEHAACLVCHHQTHRERAVRRAVPRLRELLKAGN